MTDLYDEFSDPGQRPLPTPARVLTIGAHPDDAEFGAGATLARWALHGADITMCIVTDGSKGSWDPDIDPSELTARRAQEQERAAAALGVGSIVNLGRVDGELEYSMELRLEVARQIRLARPDVVLSHDPWQRYQMHPDHRATGMAAVDGVVAAREPLAMAAAGIPPHRPMALLLWSADQPDHAEPVTDDGFEKKVAALLHHSSQSETTMGNAAEDAAARDAFVNRLAEWHRTMGAELGTTPAETFKRLTP